MRLGLLGTVVLAGRGLAQDQDRALRLSIHPRALATGARTERAGVHILTENAEDTLYVPQACVGTRRCPLLVYLDAGCWTCGTWYGKPKPDIWDWLGPVAEKYGLLILDFGNGPDPDRRLSADPENVPALEAALTEVLRTVAVDPDRIAIAGRCNTGGDAITWGDHNPAVFSRMATFTADAGDPPSRPPNQSLEYLLANSIEEGLNFDGARRLRARGYPVTQLASFRQHSHLEEDYDFLGHWLLASWAEPDPAARPRPYAFAAPAPLLTPEAIARMTAFWTRFTREPDSILIEGRRARVQEVIMPVGSEQVSVLMVNMAALADAYSSVAAALQAVGLTAAQHDAYRFALVSARLASTPQYELLGDVDTTSVLAKNVRFLAAHADELEALEKANMWYTP